MQQLSNRPAVMAAQIRTRVPLSMETSVEGARRGAEGLLLFLAVVLLWALVLLAGLAAVQ